MSPASAATPAVIAISARNLILSANIVLTSIFDSISNSKSNLDSNLRVIIISY